MFFWINGAISWTKTNGLELSRCILSRWKRRNIRSICYAGRAVRPAINRNYCRIFSATKALALPGEYCKRKTMGDISFSVSPTNLSWTWLLRRVMRISNSSSEISTSSLGSCNFASFFTGMYPFLIRKRIREYLPDQSLCNIPLNASFVRRSMVPIHCHRNDSSTSKA